MSTLDVDGGVLLDDPRKEVRIPKVEVRESGLRALFIAYMADALGKKPEEVHNYFTV